VIATSIAAPTKKATLQRKTTFVSKDNVKNAAAKKIAVIAKNAKATSASRRPVVTSLVRAENVAIQRRWVASGSAKTTVITLVMGMSAKSVKAISASTNHHHADKTRTAQVNRSANRQVREHASDNAPVVARVPSLALRAKNAKTANASKMLVS